MVVVVKTMQIKTPERLTRSVKYILNPKKTNVPYVETEKDFPVSFTENKKMMQLVSGHLNILYLILKKLSLKMFLYSLNPK